MSDSEKIIINEIQDSNNVMLSIFVFIFGIVIGAIIGYFIFKTVKYIGPDSNEIVKEIHIDKDGKKYKFKPKITVCPINYSMGKLHDKNFKESH